MDSNDSARLLIEKVVTKRAEETLKEVRRHFPEATVNTEVTDGRGILTACHGRFVVTKEFVETVESLSSAHRMTEYRHVLQGKARLVLIVPKEMAAATFTRMLELNNWWLFYYQIYFYDADGNIRRMDRKAWCNMVGRPFEAQPRAPEIV
jgi:hypothetical protein